MKTVILLLLAALSVVGVAAKRRKTHPCWRDFNSDECRELIRQWREAKQRCMDESGWKPSEHKWCEIPEDTKGLEELGNFSVCYGKQLRTVVRERRAPNCSSSEDQQPAHSSTWREVLHRFICDNHRLFTQCTQENEKKFEGMTGYKELARHVCYCQRREEWKKHYEERKGEEKREEEEDDDDDDEQKNVKEESEPNGNE